MNENKTGDMRHEPREQEIETNDRSERAKDRSLLTFLVTYSPVALRHAGRGTRGEWEW